jgi:hypothetical protein
MYFLYPVGQQARHAAKEKRAKRRETKENARPVATLVQPITSVQASLAQQGHFSPSQQNPHSRRPLI